MAALIQGDRKGKEIAEMFGVTPPYVTVVKKEAVDRGFIDGTGTVTMAGYKFAKEMEGCAGS